MPPVMDFSVKPILQGRAVTLRPFHEADGPVMLEILTQPELRRLTGSVETSEDALRPHTNQETETILQWYRSRCQVIDRLDLAIIERFSGRLVGEVVFNEVDEAAKTANFRILIGESGQDRGLGSEAIALFLDYGFLTLALSKVSLEVYAFNPRAIRVYEGSGFQLESVLPKSFHFDGQAYDTLVYGLTREQYQRASLDRWLKARSNV